MAKIVLEEENKTTDNVEIEEATTEEVVAPTEDVETEPEESEEETTEDVVITHPEEEIDSDFGVDDTEENSDEDEGVMLLPSGEEDATPVYTGETVQAAETGEGKKWDSYTTESDIADDDELMILDKSAKANKRTLLSKIADYVIGKLATAVVSKLTTTDKTIPGAINELNSKELLEVGGIIKNDFDDYRTPGAYICADFYNVKNAPSSNHDSCFMLVFNSSKSWTIQIVFSTFRYDGIYFRRSYETTTFESWHLAKST